MGIIFETENVHSRPLLDRKPNKYISHIQCEYIVYLHIGRFILVPFQVRCEFDIRVRHEPLILLTTMVRKQYIQVHIVYSLVLDALPILCLCKSYYYNVVRGGNVWYLYALTRGGIIYKMHTYNAAVSTYTYPQERALGEIDFQISRMGQVCTFLYWP